MSLFHRTTTIARSGLLHSAVDCHCHLLPKVDDGVQLLADTLSLLSTMEQQGVKRVWLTPHIMEDYPNSAEKLKDVFSKVNEAYRGNVSLKLAAEYMLDSEFDAHLNSHNLLPLCQDKKYLLVETSYFNPPIHFSHTLERILSAGYFPLLAHPERYEYMDLNEYTTLHEMGISFQLNLPSLVGIYGKGVQQRAEHLLHSGMYNLYGTDTHTVHAYLHLLDAPIRIKHLPLITSLTPTL